jgi:hypothetical protein
VPTIGANQERATEDTEDTEKEVTEDRCRKASKRAESHGNRSDPIIGGTPPLRIRGHSRVIRGHSRSIPSPSIRVNPCPSVVQSTQRPRFPPRTMAKGPDSGREEPRVAAVRSLGARRDEARAWACGWAADSVGSRRSAGNSVAWKNDRALERSTVERLSPPRTMDPMGPPPSLGKKPASKNVPEDPFLGGFKDPELE